MLLGSGRYFLSSGRYFLSGTCGAHPPLEPPGGASGAPWAPPGRSLGAPWAPPGRPPGALWAPRRRSGAHLGAQGAPREHPRSAQKAARTRHRRTPGRILGAQWALPARELRSLLMSLVEAVLVGSSKHPLAKILPERLPLDRLKVNGTRAPEAPTGHPGCAQECACGAS